MTTLALLVLAQAPLMQGAYLVGWDVVSNTCLEDLDINYRLIILDRDHHMWRLIDAKTSTRAYGYFNNGVIEFNEATHFYWKGCWIYRYIQTVIRASPLRDSFSGVGSQFFEYYCHRDGHPGMDFSCQINAMLEGARQH